MKKQQTANSAFGAVALVAILGIALLCMAGSAAAGETLVHDGKVYVQGADGIYRPEGYQSSASTSTPSPTQIYVQPSQQTTRTRPHESNAQIVTRQTIKGMLPLGPAGLLFR